MDWDEPPLPAIRPIVHDPAAADPTQEAFLRVRTRAGPWNGHGAKGVLAPILPDAQRPSLDQAVVALRGRSW